MAGNQQLRSRYGGEQSPFDRFYANHCHESHFPRTNLIELSLVQDIGSTTFGLKT